MFLNTTHNIDIFQAHTSTINDVNFTTTFMYKTVKFVYIIFWNATLFMLENIINHKTIKLHSMGRMITVHTNRGKLADRSLKKIPTKENIVQCIILLP